MPRAYTFAPMAPAPRLGTQVATLCGTQVAELADRAAATIQEDLFFTAPKENSGEEYDESNDLAPPGQGSCFCVLFERKAESL